MAVTHMFAIQGDPIVISSDEADDTPTPTPTVISEVQHSFALFFYSHLCFSSMTGHGTQIFSRDTKERFC